MKKKVTTTILLLCFIIGFSQSDTSYYEILRNEPLNTNNLNLGLNFRLNFSYNNASIGPDLSANYRYKRYAKFETSIYQALFDEETEENFGNYETASNNRRHNELYIGGTIYIKKTSDKSKKNVNIGLEQLMDEGVIYHSISIPFLTQKLYGVNFGIGQFESRIINKSELLRGYEVSKPDSIIENFDWHLNSHIKYQFIKIGFNITKLEDLELKLNEKIVRDFARKKETSLNLLLAFNNVIDNTIKRPIDTEDVFQYNFSENSKFRPIGIESKWSVESLQLWGTNGRMFIKVGIAPGYNKFYHDFFMELGGGFTLSKKI